jgi:hypothetical protein
LVERVVQWIFLNKEGNFCQGAGSSIVKSKILIRINLNRWHCLSLCRSVGGGGGRINGGRKKGKESGENLVDEFLRWKNRLSPLFF